MSVGVSISVNVSGLSVSVNVSGLSVSVSVIVCVCVGGWVSGGEKWSEGERGSEELCVCVCVCLCVFDW